MLGIVGGMGPLASALFYEMLIRKTPAEKDQEHMDLILLSHSSMPDRTATILHGSETDKQHVQSLLEKDVERL
ncbi:MAG: aspartate racemase, partial [Baileyella intestinalis]|nr:aspartate racemase [Baileyella intestinalis]